MLEMHDHGDGRAPIRTFNAKLHIGGLQGLGAGARLPTSSRGVPQTPLRSYEPWLVCWQPPYHIDAHIISAKVHNM